MDAEVLSFLLAVAVSTRFDWLVVDLAELLDRLGREKEGGSGSLSWSITIGSGSLSWSSSSFLVRRRLLRRVDGRLGREVVVVVLDSFEERRRRFRDKCRWCCLTLLLFSWSLFSSSVSWSPCESSSSSSSWSSSVFAVATAACCCVRLVCLLLPVGSVSDDDGGGGDDDVAAAVRLLRDTLFSFLFERNSADPAVECTELDDLES